MPCAPTGPSNRSTHVEPEACLGPCPATSSKLVHSAPVPALGPALCPSCPLKKRNGPAATQTGQPDLARAAVFFIGRTGEGWYGAHNCSLDIPRVARRCPAQFPLLYARPHSSPGEP